MATSWNIKWQFEHTYEYEKGLYVWKWIYRTAAGTWQHSGALCPIYEFSYTNITNSDIRLIHSTYIIYAIRGVIQIECTPVAWTNSRVCMPSFKFLGELLGYQLLPFRICAIFENMANKKVCISVLSETWRVLS